MWARALVVSGSGFSWTPCPGAAPTCTYLMVRALILWSVHLTYGPCTYPMVRALMLWSGTVLVLTLPCTAAGPGLEDKVEGCCKKMYRHPC